MEVVILGESALKNFLGETNVMALKKFVEDRLDVTALCDSLLPKFTITTNNKLSLVDTPVNGMNLTLYLINFLLLF